MQHIGDMGTRVSQPCALFNVFCKLVSFVLTSEVPANFIIKNYCPWIPARHTAALDIIILTYIMNN